VRAAEAVDDERLVGAGFAEHPADRHHDEDDRNHPERRHDEYETGYAEHGFSPCWLRAADRQRLTFGQFIPRTDVRDSVFVTRDDHFGSLLQGQAALAPRAVRM